MQGGHAHEGEQFRTKRPRRSLSEHERKERLPKWKAEAAKRKNRFDHAKKEIESYSGFSAQAKGGHLLITYEAIGEGGLGYEQFYYVPTNGRWWRKGDKRSERHASHPVEVVSAISPHTWRKGHPEEFWDKLRIPTKEERTREKQREERQEGEPHGEAESREERGGGNLGRGGGNLGRERTGRERKGKGQAEEPNAGGTESGKGRGSRSGQGPGLVGESGPAVHPPNIAQRGENGDLGPGGSAHESLKRSPEPVASARSAVAKRADASVPGSDADAVPGETTPAEVGPDGADAVPGDAAAPAAPDEERAPAEEPEGFLTSKATVWREQARLVHGAWLRRVDWTAVPDRCHATYPEQAARFFAHVVASGARRLRECGGWVPVCARLIERELGVHRTEDIWRPLVEAGLLEWRPHYSGVLSREFRLPPALRDELLAARPADAGARYNLHTNRPDNARPSPKPHATDSDGRPIVPLIREARTAIWETGCLFDREHAEAHVEELRRAHRAAFAAWEAQGRPQARRTRNGELLEPMSPAEQAMLEARGRWHHDQYSLDQMLLFAPEHVAGSVWRYKPRFVRDPQSGGRVTEIGGLQSASVELKDACLGRLQDFGVYNYDLKSSQVFGLVHEFEDAGVSTGWLTRYLKADKTDYAARAFGSRERVRLWKDCLLALMMGAALPNRTKPTWKKNPDGAWEKMDPDIACYIRGAFGGGGSTDEAEAALDSFAAVVREFDADRKAWHRYLVGPYIEEHARYGRGGRYLANAAGVTFDVQAHSGWKLKSKLAAFLLQGLEVEFIGRLTLLGPMYGFRPASNQHDGLVTEGAIPEDAVAEALEQSELRYARLVEKPFV